MRFAAQPRRRPAATRSTLLRRYGAVPGAHTVVVDKLALAAQVRLELRKHAKHVQEALASGCAGVERLFCGLQGRAPSA